MITAVCSWAQQRPNDYADSIVLVTIALAYPLLREAGFPNDTLVGMASAVNEERGSSLKTRFEQEDQLRRALRAPHVRLGTLWKNRVHTRNRRRCQFDRRDVDYHDGPVRARGFSSAVWLAFASGFSSGPVAAIYEVRGGKTILSVSP